MPRLARIVAPNTPHHIHQSSIEGQIVFSDNEDYKTYLDKMVEAAKENKVEVIAYCLSPDKINLVVKPKDTKSLGQMIRQLHSFYSRYYNQKNKHSGNIWGERYESCPVETAHLGTVVRYVERSFVTKGSRKKIENYDWNSAADHTSKKKSVHVSDKWPTDAVRKKWSAFINEKPSDDETAAVEYCTRRGYAYGSSAFIKKLEAKLGRSVAPKRAK